MHVIANMLRDRGVDNQVHDLAQGPKHVSPEDLAALRIRFGERLVIQLTGITPRPGAAD